MDPADARPGYEFVLAAHWLPVRCHPMRWRSAPGSVATALRPTVAARGGAWVGCTTCRGEQGRLVEDLWLHPVALSEQEVADYYHGQCLGTFARLYCDCGPQAQFSPAWRAAYRAVNRRVAERVAGIAAPGATAWVHDYHLQLVPGLLRQIRPDLRIGYTLHTPFPPVERFVQQPLRKHILTGLLGADLIAFPPGRSAINFIDCAGAVGQYHHDAQTVRVGTRQVTVGVFSSSVDARRIADAADTVEVRARAAAFRRAMGSPRLVLLSVGTPEPSLGVRRCLDVYARLLADSSLDPRDTVLVHIGDAGDDSADIHRAERESIDRSVAQINGTYARVGRPVVHYLRREADPLDLLAIYAAADVMLALPLHQGMSLAAKEFVAARTANTGSLVLSEFTGAAHDLPEADIVNPYDLESVVDTVLAATASCRVPNTAMSTMRSRLAVLDTHAWAEDYLGELASLVSPSRPDLEKRSSVDG